MSIVCWVVNRSPSDEFDHFRKDWVSMIKSPFPDSVLGVIGGLYDALVQVLHNQDFEVVSAVWERRNFLDSQAGDSDYTTNPDRNHVDIGEWLGLRQVEISSRSAFVSNLNSDPVPDDAFVVPPGFRRAKK